MEDKNDKKYWKREQNRDKPIEQTCAVCGRTYMESPFGYLARGIMQHKPACSLECNKALGQVK